MQTARFREGCERRARATLNIWLASRTVFLRALVIHSDGFTFRNRKEKRSYLTGTQGVGGEGIMMANKKVGLIVSLGVAAVLMMTALPVRANLDLEKSQEWKGIGDTVVYGTYAKDVDGDNTTEILTVGSTYDGNPAATKAQLRIWNWNDNTDTLTLEKDYEYVMGTNSTNSVFRGVYAAVLDYDSDVEIVTVGYYVDWQGYYHDHTAIWRWDGTTLTLDREASQTIDSKMRSVFVAEINGDNYPEIATVGERGVGTALVGKLYVFNWDGSSLTLMDSEEWGATVGGGQDIQVRSVFIEDVSWTSTKEVITAGYYYDTSQTYGEVRVYNYTVTGGVASLSFVAVRLYQYSSSTTEFYSVFAGELKSGNGNKMAACGWWNDRGTHKGIVDVIKYDASSRNLVDVDDDFWYNGTATECHAIYAANVTGNSDLEIFAGGFGTFSGTQNGQIVTFNFDGSALVRKGWNNWYVIGDTQVHAVYAKNVDGDSDVEVISGGQAKDAGGTLNGHLRIWHWV